MERIIIHCSDTENGKSVSNQQIDSWHRARGFKKIGYHFVIDVNGEINKGRNTDEMGAHTEGHNMGSVGICLIGKNKYSVSQFNSLRGLLNEIVGEFEIPLWNIYGHYEFDRHGKTCPGFRITNLLCWYFNKSLDAMKEHIL